VQVFEENISVLILHITSYKKNLLDFEENLDVM
jgi:hypothetical protein